NRANSSFGTTSNTRAAWPIICASSSRPRRPGKSGNRMQMTTPGLVLREVKFRESDRMLTILTPQGVVSASAKGSLRLKSKLFSACGLFCYSDFTLYEGRDGVYSVDEAQVRRVFFELRSRVEALALGM